MRTILICTSTIIKADLLAWQQNITPLLPSAWQLSPHASWQFPNHQQKLNLALIRQLQTQLNKNIGTLQFLYCLFNLHQASNIVQNSLLKIVEEPPAQVFFILHTANLTYILPTLQSRCHLINIKPQLKKIHYQNKLAFTTWSQMKPSQLAHFLYQQLNQLQKEEQPESEINTYILSVWQQLLFEIDEQVLTKTNALSPRQILNLKKLIQQGQTYLSNNLSPKNVLSNFAYQYYQIDQT